MRLRGPPVPPASSAPSERRAGTASLADPVSLASRETKVPVEVNVPPATPVPREPLAFPVRMVRMVSRERGDHPAVEESLAREEMTDPRDRQDHLASV